MARKIQHRRGNQEQNDLFTGAPGEITFDSDLKTLRVHDGETTGGTKLLNETLASQKYTKIDLSNVSTTGKDFISSLGMPSGRYINLTLKDSGTEYIAPANGWVQIVKSASAVGQYLTAGYLDLPNTGTDSRNIAMVWSAGAFYHSLFFPVRKSQKFYINYTFEGNTASFKFIYSQGSN